MDKQLLIWWFIHLILDLFNSWESSEAQGFSLNGTDYSNHSTVLRTDIGEGPDALLCTTDYIYCCYESYYASDGRFYFPNNTQVPALRNIGSSGYYKNSDDRVINLNRQSENGVLTGQFSCEIPTVNGYWYHYTISVFYINIVDMLVTISPSGLDIAGQNYTLLCAVMVTGSNDQPAITWLRDDGVEINSTSNITKAVSMNSSDVDSAGNYSAKLMFSPLAASHAGTYTCRVNLDDAQVTDSISVVVKGVYLSLNGVIYANNSVISITEIGETSNIYTTSVNTGLQCITDRRPCCSSFPNRYGQWFFPDGTTVPSLSYNSLFYRNRGDDGTVNLNRVNASVTMPTGQFCCMVHDAADTEQTVCADIIVSIMIITADIPTAGEIYSLNCSVSGTSDPAATYRWFDGSGTQLIIGSKLQFSPLRASDAGTYKCQATLEGVVVEENTTVNVNLPAPADVRVTYPIREIIAGSSTDLNCTVELNPAVDVPVNITTEWSGPARTTFLPNRIVPTDMINLITYSSTITVDAAKNGSYTCTAIIDSGGITFGSTDITVAPLPAPTDLVATGMTTSILLTWKQPEGSVDSYILDYEFSINECSGNEGTVRKTISDGSLRMYTIVNSADTPVEEDSMYYITLIAVNLVDTSEPSNSARVNTRIAAPGPPPNLAASSVNVTSIIIQWDPIPCQDRNRQFDFYRVFYYLISFSDTSATISAIVSASIREFTATALPPRTNCIFQVQAFDVHTSAQGSFANLTVNTSESEELGFLLNGQLYGNNSVITVTDIGSSFFVSALFCLTPSLECCSDSETPNAASVTREWYLPNGRPVRYADTVFSREQVSSAVSLYRNDSTSLSGVFRCEIPDASGASQSIYIGIYPQSIGFPSITSVQFDRNSTMLTCTSTGGPPTTVAWKKNGLLVNASPYEQSQRLVDAESATYENVLYSYNVANFVGSFTCEISNVRRTVERTVELNGVFIVHDQFRVGEFARATCTSDTPTTRMEWIRNGVVFASAVSTQEVVLSISQVTDNIHGQVYVCRVTRNGGMVATQNFTVQVNVPSDVIQVGIEPSGNSIAGETYSLTCNVSVVSGLTNSPGVIWTNESGAILLNGITISTTVESSYSVSVLTFDPLRTSHGDIYTCDGTIDSPALDSSWAAFMQETVTVQISTPDVSITVPSGPLYAGALSFTLTCNISINLATDSHDIREEDMNITWLRGDTVIWTGGRDTISALEGSRRTLFISQLTLTPLSTEDTTFTCRAVARPPAGSGFISISEIGQQTVNVSVEFPPTPSVSIVSTGSSTAGLPHHLNCSVTVISGLASDPSLQWEGPGVGQPGVEVSGESTSGRLSLSFSSLLTGHGGVYTCIATLSVPGATIAGNNTIIIIVKIPPRPDLMDITVSPLSDYGFFAGLDLTFTCNITLDSAINTPVTVLGMWYRNGTVLTNDGNRITVMRSPMSTPPYTTSIRLNPVRISDTGTYTCAVTVTPENRTHVIGMTYNQSQSITIGEFPIQSVGPISTEGSSTAGFSGYKLICNANKNPFLSTSATLAVQWLDPNDAIISERNRNFTISGVGPTTNTVLTSRLTFNHLYTSQAGEYTCRTLLTIPGTVDNHTIDETVTVSVKLPPPESVRIALSREAPHYEGTTFSLTCTITPNRTGIDTGFVVNVPTFSGPGAPPRSDVTMITDNMDFQTSLSFISSNPLAMRNTGTFSCSSIVVSTPQVPNIDQSDATTAEVNIIVTRLTEPNVSIQAGSTPFAGQHHTLNCFASTEDYVVGVLMLNWVSIDSISGVTEGHQIDASSTTARRSLTFNPVRSSHAGQYTCRAHIAIPQAESNVHLIQFNTAQQTVSVQIPPPLVSIPDPLTTPYNGTEFTLTGRVVFDHQNSVDTPVTISTIWSSSSGLLEATSQTDDYSLIFQPIATNSSGTFTLTVTIQPSDNSEFIIGSSGNASYNLVVRALPSRPPNVTIVSRRELDDCGEVMTLSCTTNQVENLFSPPAITWIAPDGSEVSTVESNNRQSDPETGELIFSDITPNNNGRYTCRAIINIPEAQIDNYYDEATVQVHANAPGIVQNLVCTQSSSPSVLSFSWDPPTPLGSEVVTISYQLRVTRLEHRPGTREVIQYDVYEKLVDTRVSEASVTGLVAEVPYNVTVKALNLAGCGEESQMYCFTQEGVPPPPENVVVKRFDSTSIGVSWTKFTLVELKGLADYIVAYNIIIDSTSSRKRQTQLGGTMTVPWTQNHIIISGLQTGAEYNVTVRVSTAAGTSAPASPEAAATPASSSSVNTLAIIGGAVAVVIVIVIAITVLIAIALALRSRRAEFSPNQKSLPYESPGSTVLSNQPPNDKEKEVYETVETDQDHEYEILDKFNQPRAQHHYSKGPPLNKPAESVQLQPLSSTGDYDFSQCPAYVSVATTSIHGNTAEHIYN